MLAPPPSAESLRHRGEIAKLISPLRRVRPRVSFWKLAAHRIPTLWTLYRGLIRHADRDNVRDRIRELFRENRYITSARAAKERLAQGHKWLDTFQRAKAGDAKLRAILDRYDRMIAVKREEQMWRECIHQVFTEEAAARTRPIFKGSFIRQTFSNRLLPRLVPQPENIGGIIRWRRSARERRLEKKEELRDWMDDLKRECALETELSQGHGLGKRDFTVHTLRMWLRPLQDKLKDTEDALMRDVKRLHAPYPRQLLLAAKRARQRRVANKTLQKEREARGLYFPSTLRRMKKGPPTHILEKMTPEQLKLYRISLGPAEGGYTAAVKLKQGMKLRKAGLWRLEGGQEQNQTEVEQRQNEIMAENERRRCNTDDRTGTK
ncbi:hypothetical protein ID866_5497 [Astraeus odoratus]|nr:hypothetical protein ID866_5497 [Astraeus odoratus]